MKRKKSKRSFIGKFFHLFVACFTSKYKLYRITALISFIVRFALTTFLPNPVEPIVAYITSLWHWSDLAIKIISWLIILLIDNFIIANVMHFTTFTTVGNFYKPRTEGDFGSLSYLYIYCLQYASLVVCIRWFEWYTILPFLLGYLAVCGFLYGVSFTNIKVPKFQLNPIGSKPVSFEDTKGYTLPDKWIRRLILHAFLFAIFAAGIITIKILYF